MKEHNWTIEIPYNPSIEVTLKVTCENCNEVHEGTMELSQVLEFLGVEETNCGGDCYIEGCIDVADEKCSQCDEGVCDNHCVMYSGEVICNPCRLSYLKIRRNQVQEEIDELEEILHGN